jgi:hypothetical protein
MFESSMLRKALALVCGFSAVAAVEPLPGAGLAASGPSIVGTMTAFGPAETRKVRTREATLFSGDRVRSLEHAYVRIFLSGGHHLELSSNTDVMLAKKNDSTEVAMFSGRVGFVSSLVGPLRFEVQSLTVLAEPGVGGSIESTSVDRVSIAVVKGQIKVRNDETQEWFVLRPGTTTAFGLHGRQPLDEPIPANARTLRPEQQKQEPPPPVNQDPATIKVPPAGGSKPIESRVLIIAGVGVAGALIIAAIAGNDNVASPSAPR